MRPDAIFRIASMTKPITPVTDDALGRGTFQLRDPVSVYPEFTDQRVSTTSDASGETGAHAGQPAVDDS